MAFVLKIDRTQFPSNVLTSAPVWLYENCQPARGNEVFIWWTKVGGVDGVAMHGVISDVVDSGVSQTGRKQASVTAAVDATRPRRILSQRELAEFDYLRGRPQSEYTGALPKLWRKFRANSHHKIAALDQDEADYLRSLFDLTSKPAEEAANRLPISNGPAPRIDTSDSRIIRDTQIGQRVKSIHNFCCQVCGTRLETKGGPYAEAAHIQPLGSPHDGPDVPENVLCLCPNHHVLLDYGVLSVADDLSLIGEVGHLRTVPSHNLDLKYLRYQREFWQSTGD